MSTYIDHLAQWWENAEESDNFYPGDTWIKRTQAQTGGYVYDVGRVTSKKRYYEARVLARAPKPKPAWHDAVAVMAQTAGRSDRRVFIRGDDGWWEDGDGTYEADELAYVTPLIEAKVTAEMVDAAYAYAPSIFPTKATARRVLTAALGIVTE